MQNKIAGSGQHSHPVPTVPGLIVEILDGNHNGTSVWLSPAGGYVFACHERKTVEYAARCVLIRGLDTVAIGNQPCGLDLDSPDGLALVGLGADEPVPTSEGAEILWDSESHLAEESRL